MAFRVAVLTVSDRCANGESEDRSGPAIIEYLTPRLTRRTTSSQGGGDSSEQVPAARSRLPPSFVTLTVPDDVERIQKAIREWSSLSLPPIDFIVTTGGTGFSTRDNTPEAVRPLLDKEAPGMVHAMMATGLQNTPFAWLSRGVCGVVNRSLVCTLPGSPKAVVECLSAVAESGLPHALELVRGNNHDAHPTTTTTTTTANKAAAVSAASTKPVVGGATAPSRFSGSGCTGACGRSEPQRQHTDPSSSLLPSSLSPPHSAANRARVSAFPMTPMAEALRLIAANCPPPRRTTIDLRRCDSSEGYLLSDDVASAFPQPPFRASVKDGYAVRCPPFADSKEEEGDGGASSLLLNVTGSLCAGHDLPESYRLGPNDCCRVNTGGPIPDDADAVVQVEDTELVEKTSDGAEERVIRLFKYADRGPKWIGKGQDIRPVGCDLEAGQVALTKGLAVGPAEVALAMAVGRTVVPVWRKPIVAVLSTGDELVVASSPSPPPSSVGAREQQKIDDGMIVPPKGKIFDSNREMLIAAARPYASRVIDAGLAKDELGDTSAKMRAALQGADIVLSTGGVSMGEVDHVKAVLDRLGAQTHFGRVNMKPGKPTTFATLDTMPPATGDNGDDGDNNNNDSPPHRRRLYFGLPGNPVSALVCFHLFVVPALRQMSGVPEGEAALPSVRARVIVAGGGGSIRLDKERPEYHRCRLRFDHANGEFTCQSTGQQASSRLLSISGGANGLMVLPVGTAENGYEVKTGSVVEVVVIGQLA